MRRRPRTSIPDDFRARRQISGGVAVQQLDVDILRAAEEGDPHTGPYRLRLDSEFGALFFELGDDSIDPIDAQPDMLEPEIRWLRRCGDRLLRRDLRNENIHSPELEIEGWPAIRM